MTDSSTLQLNLDFGFADSPNRTVAIHNRRYLGNKFKLQGFIKSVIENNCDCWNSFFDVFAGTGAVAAAYGEKRIITNDI